MSDTQQQTDAPEQQTEGDETQQEKEQTFTQADVDRIVRERVKRERDKYADYGDLQEKAGKVKTAEDRIADLEKQYKAAEARALRSDIAAAHGISAEDRDLFLTGEDEETLTAQAKRLADRESERKKRSNHVPNEGNNPKPGSDEYREFANQLFDRALSE